MGFFRKDDLNELSKNEIARIRRHLILPEIGKTGQLKLKAGRVLMVGVGGLGSPAALYLAAAGVGNLGLIDDDKVDISNLQRQVLDADKDRGKSKTATAKKTLLANPDIEIETYGDRLTSQNALDIFKTYDVIINGSDELSHALSGQ